MFSIAISTNRTGHRATDVSHWRPTLIKKVSAFFKHPHHLLPQIHLGHSKIVSKDKLLNGN